MSTRQTSGPWTMTKGEFEESVASLERAIARQGGNPCAVFDQLRTDDGFADRIAQAMLRDEFDGSIETRLARVLLGSNIFDVADWTALYNAKFTKK